MYTRWKYKLHAAVSFHVLLASLFSMVGLGTFQATDTLTFAQVLRDGDTMVSSGGSFELGFFNPGISKNRYVGIWYNKITTRTVVWVANRGIPLLTNGSGTLAVVEPGTLALLDEYNKTIWFTNSSNPATSPIVQLLDTGNLVLRDANGNPDDFLWQSFDHPTDTLLPGMKLGRNFRTGREVYLWSWKSKDDPDFGDYTYHLDPTGYPQLTLSRGGVKISSSGPWNGAGFSGAQNVKENTFYRFEFVMNEDEVYYRYELLQSDVISRFMVNVSGVAQRWNWVDQTKDWTIYLTAPVDNCDTYRICGAYGSCNIADSPLCRCLDRFVPRDPDGWSRTYWSEGCVPRTSLDCEKGDGFLKYSGIKLPDTNSSWYNVSLNLDQCKAMCSKNCLCMAYTSLDIRRGGRGCLLWFNELVDMRTLSPGGQDIHIRMASSELDSDGWKRTLKVILFLVCGILVLVLGLILYMRKMKKSGFVGGRERLEADHGQECGDEEDLKLPLFDLQTITKVTDNFSFNNKIGEGGFGSVYKGLLEEGEEIAVKRLSRTSLQGVDEFKNEVICIAKLQHRNLVKLLGCCIQGEEKMLIYEYMTNRSLDLIIFDAEKSRRLDWPKRLHIINGIARGLMYLHQDSRLRIIHRDLKASNVLLDSDMNPKISDFGMARMFGGNETEANTNRVVGTYGYMSPEYAIDGLFSVKSDVYSFGVLVLEIISGKKNRGFYHRDHQLNLLGHAWMLYKEGRTLGLIESDTRHTSYSSEILRSIHIGLLCVQQHPEDRPSMSSVVLMLGNEGVLPEAKQPGFFAGRDVFRPESSSTSYTASSTNVMSITLPEAR